MDDEYDELMGPSQDDLQRILRSESAGRINTSSGSPGKNDEPEYLLRRSASSGNVQPPPSAVFNQMSERWSDYEPDPEEAKAATARAVAVAAEQAAMRESLVSAEVEKQNLRSSRSPLPFEDEQAVEDQKFNIEKVGDGRGIPQEALKVVEVADSQLAGSSYSVHRTVSGGFCAEPKSLGNKKRVPQALAGIGAATMGRSSGRKPYRDSPFVSSPPSSRHSSVPKTRGGRQTQEDFEYGDDSVVDVIGMEQRFASSRPAEENEKPKNWSSRYSIDHTMLALSGGSVSSNRFLDEMDNRHANHRERISALNLISGGTSNNSKFPKVFGNTAGFSFRDRHVFGKQNVTVPPPKAMEPNLNAAWLDDDESASPVDSPAKSWQEQLDRKNMLKRRYTLIALLFITFGVAVTVAGMLGNHTSSESATAAEGIESSVTFYATSDIPHTPEEEAKLTEELNNLSGQTDFIVHLGNIQDPDVSGCSSSQYENVAGLLRQSPVTVFVLPGQADWANCPDQFGAFGQWLQKFRFFDVGFSHGYKVDRQAKRQENFAFEDSGVLFMGVHVVGGDVPKKEASQRNDDNVAWVQGMTVDHLDSVRAVVVFGNARPGLPQNVHFFYKLNKLAGSINVPVAYVHAHSGHGRGSGHHHHKGLENVSVIEMEDGGRHPPTRINVGFGDKPFIIG